ncbi:MAG: ribose-phosphate pyrophosphokinase [Acidilobaceae archaeon]
MSSSIFKCLNVLLLTSSYGLLELAVIVSGSRDYSRSIARAIALRLNLKLVDVLSKRFPDGELYVRVVNGLEDEHYIIVQSMEPPSSNSIIELILLLDALSEFKPREVTLVAPYLPYARQDKVFLRGEPISVRALLKTFKTLGVNRLITVEAHSPTALSYFPGDVINIRPLEYMAKLVGFSSDILVISPDIGGIDRARRVAEALNARSDYIVKRRDRVTGEILVEPRELDPRGLEVLIVDDIISTGGTIAEVARILREKDASKINVMTVHYLNIEGALERILKFTDRIIASNTIQPLYPDKIEYIDVIPLICDTLTTILERV